jgi:hypothetical protein
MHAMKDLIPGNTFLKGASLQVLGMLCKKYVYNYASML